jgi:hypothetical protein
LGVQAEPVRSETAGPEASITLFLSRTIWLTASAAAELVTSATASTPCVSNHSRVITEATSALFWWSATRTSIFEPFAARPESSTARRAAATDPGPPISA